MLRLVLSRRFLLAVGAAALLGLLRLPFGSAQGGPSQSATPATRAAVQVKPAESKQDIKKSKQEYEAGQQAERAGDWSAAFAHYSEAASHSLDNKEYQIRLALARFRLVQQHVSRAEREAVSGRFQAARQELLIALQIDPGYTAARERLEQIESMARRQPVEVSGATEGQVELRPAQGTHSFNYRGDTRGAYEDVARKFGLTASFDPEMRRKSVRFRVDDVDFWTAMSLLSEMSNTFWRPVNFRLFFVADRTPQKLNDYDFEVVRTLVLPESDTPDQMTETVRLVRDMAGITRTQLDAATRTLTMRASPAKVALALDLVQQLEQTRGELMLEVDILEVDRDAERKLGIRPPTSASIFTISKSQIQSAQGSLTNLLQLISQIFGQPSALAGLTQGQISALVGSGQISLGSLLPPLIAFGGGSTIFLSTLPGTAAEFSEVLSLIRHGQHMLLRAEDGKKASFFIGDRFPVSLATLSPSLGTPSFVPTISSSSFPRTDFATGKGPVSVKTGDFNGDGKVDLVVANQTDNTVSILFGNGDGTFQTPTAASTFPTGTAPSAVIVADFNGDGIPDLAVTNSKDNTVSILLGNATNGVANGTFQPKKDFPVGDTPVALAAADFNGDSNLDLAVVNRCPQPLQTGCSPTVSILLGNGDGTFQAKTDFATGNQPVSIATGDFNGDSVPDLAIANNSDNTVSVLLANVNVTTGKGDGTFAKRTDYPTGAGPAAVLTADFNLDMVLDLAVANQTDNTVSVLLGNVNANTTRGDGTFGAKTDFATGTGPVALATADFNSDGFPDLVTADQSANNITVLINNQFGGFTTSFNLAVGNGPVSVTTGDFAGTGRTDVATANQTDSTVSVILNNVLVVPGSSTEQTAFPAAQYIDLGLKVEATPRLHPNNEVTLKMQIEVKSLSGSNFNGIPVITNRTIDQTIRLREGEATALAGLLQPQETVSIAGWPGLAHVFGTRETQKQDTELLILVTPRLIRLAPHIERSVYAGHGAAPAAVAEPQR